MKSSRPLFITHMRQLVIFFSIFLFVSHNVSATQDTTQRSIGTVAKEFAWATLGSYGGKFGKTIQMVFKEKDKTRLAINFFKYIFALTDDDANKTPPIPKEIEGEVAQQVIHILNNSTPEQILKMTNKHAAEKINLNAEETRKKLINEPEFRKKVAEQIGCGMYVIFRMFGWQSMADTTNYEKYQELIERTNLDQIPLMFGPFRDQIENLVITLAATCFEQNGTIIHNGNAHESLAEYVSARHVQLMFPHSWRKILDQTKMTGLAHGLAQAEILKYHGDQRPIIIQRFSALVFDPFKQLERIMEKKEYNRNLIYQKRKREQMLQKVREKQKIKEAKKARQKEKLIQQRETFAKKFDLDNHKDKQVQQLLSNAAQSQHDMHKSINLLLNENGSLTVCSNRSRLGRIMYERMFDSNGVYRLIEQKDGFIATLAIPEDMIGQHQFMDVRRALNRLAYLRAQEMGDTPEKNSQLVTYAEQGLRAIPQALRATGSKRIKIMNELDKLCETIKDNNYTKAKSAASRLNKRLNPKKRMKNKKTR